MVITPFYTVVENDPGRFIVRYVEPPNWTVQEFRSDSSDPGEASQEFKRRFPSYEYVSKVAFDQYILMEKLKIWTI